MTQVRSSLIDSGSTPYYRCVRRANLCGEDHLTEKNVAHHRQWVVDPLVSIFAVEACADL
ncbi:MULTISPECIES: hypothetical protein [unclassified Endozoicomonas]|uniref:hypothetical protein n=1 Tax=unclassified Endozoicomonas TaxID=2644528 RepID=UPI0021478A8D|nr:MULTISPECIES: hypothetical protein [unclassified Endozoicomonas]